MNVSRTAPWALVFVAAGIVGCGDQTTLVADAGPCAEGLSSCDGVCVDTRSSTAHCGACGAACGPARVCAGSTCTAMCGAGLAVCAGVCTDLAADPANCGACGDACAAGLVCAAGACSVACSGNLSRCGDLCVDTANDPANCGACDAPCPPGYGCSNGRCVLTCDGVDCGGTCVDIAIDPTHCGGCGNACVVGQLCVGGDCVEGCGPGVQDCDGTCKDLELDPSNCGSCGRVCAAGLVCSNGDCALSCAGGTTRCGDACVDTDVDPAHCGGCDAPCPSGEICADGACEPCPPGKVPCKGACIPTDADVANCGGCGLACPYVPGGTAVCSGGECSAKCSPGYGDCDQSGLSCETYLQWDEQNCGACGEKCGANSYCDYGDCHSCDAGQTLCGSWCVDTMTDTYHCGGCNHSCPYAGGNTERFCAGGICQTRCYSGYVDCDGDPANGCEVSVTSDRTNCGTCGIACDADEVCTNGSCQGCAAGKSVCTNSCVDLTSSPSNCGGCGRSCVSYLPHATVSCVASVCTAVCSAGYLDCDGDPLTGCEAAIGPSNCGACDVVCTAPQFCAKSFACATCAPIDLGSTVPQTVTGTTIGKGDQFDSYCGYGNAPDVHYSFTAPATAAYTFDTIGSSFDTVLEVRNGGCDGPRLTCNNDGGGAGTSKLTVSLAQDQVVTIIVDGRYGSQGSYTLNVK